MVYPPIIKRIRAHGGEIALTGDSIRLKVPASFRDEAVADVKAHKDAIKCALKDEAGNPWDAEDYRAFYNERAGIAEFDWHLPRPAAEAEAFDFCIIEWLNRHPQPTDATLCPQCRRGPSEDDPLLPFGTNDYGYNWVHLCCWPNWFAGRKEEAALVLAAVGIAVSGSSQRDV